MKTSIIIIFLLSVEIIYGQKLDKISRRAVKQELDSISVSDQKYRWELMLGELNVRKLDSLKKIPKSAFWNRVQKVGRHEIGFSKFTSDSLWILQKHLDSINVERFTALIIKYGYPSYKRTGSYTSATISLHLMGENNFIKFLPIFKSELEKGNMPAGEYAQWYDRNQLIQNKKQLYGEYDVINPCVENLELTNIERKKIGLNQLNNNNCK